MDRRKRPFSLNKRAATRGKPTWYAKIRDPETGAYAERVSTGQTTKVGAEEWTCAYIARQAQKAAERRTAVSRITLAEVARGFWEPTGFYAESLHELLIAARL